MEMLHKNRIGLGDLHGPESHAVGLKRDGDTEHDKDSDVTDSIPVKPGRELVEVSHQGARCYRLEKTRCGKKSCRCARGELHGPYWYAYYRENGRMRCEYIGKSLPELVSLENRAHKACRRAQAERGRAEKIVSQLEETLRRTRGRIDGRGAFL